MMVQVSSDFCGEHEPGAPVSDNGDSVAVFIRIRIAVISNCSCPLFKNGHEVPSTTQSSIMRRSRNGDDDIAFATSALTPSAVMFSGSDRLKICAPSRAFFTSQDMF